MSNRERSPLYYFLARIIAFLVTLVLLYVLFEVILKK